MATAGSIVIDLLMRTGSFETDTKRAERRLKDMEKTIEVWSKRIAFSTVAAGSALAAWTVSMSKTMDSAVKMADQIGTTTEALTGLRYAAQQMSNVSDGTLDMSLRRMTRRIAEAAAGGGAAKKALEDLGLSARELVSLSVDEQFLRISDAMSKAGNQGSRLRNTMAIFDTEGVPLITTLSQGREEIQKYITEAEKFGIVISTDAARAASDFQTNLTRLQSMMSGLSITLGNQLMPVLNDFIQGAIDASNETDGILDSAKSLANDSALPEWMNVTGRGLAILADAAIFLGKSIGVIGGAFRSVLADAEVAVKGMQRLQVWNWFSDESAQSLSDSLQRRNDTVSRFNDSLENLMKYDGAAIMKAWDDAWAKAQFREGFVGPMPQAATLDPVTITPPGGGAARGRSQIDEGARFLKQMQERVELIGKETEYEQMLARIRIGSLSFATQAQQDQALAYAQVLDLLKEQEEAYKAIEETNREARRIFDSLRTEEEATRESYERRREIILESTIATAEEKAEALLRLEEQANDELLEINGSYWEKYLAAAEENLTSFDELAGNVLENFSRQFGNAFESMVFDAESLGDAARGMAEGMARAVVNALGQMAAQWLAYQAVQLLVGKTTQASGATALAANASATALQAGLAAFASTAAIPIVGPALAPAAMGAALAITTPLAAAVGMTALAGMAHDGIDSVPQTGTWLLEKGERVMTSQTSARLDAMLERIDSGNRVGGGMNVNIIENPDRAGQVDRRTNEDGDEEADVFVADIYGDGRRARALEQAYGLRRMGR